MARMGFNDKASGKCSISALLNPTETPDNSLPPQDFLGKGANHGRSLNSSSSSSQFRSSGSGYSLPPFNTLERDRYVSSSSRPNITTDTGTVRGRSESRYAHTVEYRDRGGYKSGSRSYKNSSSNPTSNASVFSGLPLRSEQQAGSLQSTPSPIPPLSGYLGPNPLKNSPTHYPNDSFYYTFPLEPGHKYPPTYPSHLPSNTPMTRTTESPPIKKCLSCGVTHTVLWRKSKVNPGNYLCNRCGLWERNNRVERTPLAEGHTSSVRGFVVQSPYSSGGDILE
ncbi:hypothetical protein BT96DRAFT_603406 [Gymnopus androsaceus JB14]|uniref:GATA-type domain-containing protein n=1 Tax=Gymnopus androsaceus JB14 TaxID=1447944 RepID=A0A6A4HUV1_9AGAR|nr:hypothetical protein BT96DRAFT_603406 [Gymnopus androsaceus JB14]